MQYQQQQTSLLSSGLSRDQKYSLMFCVHFIDACCHRIQANQLSFMLKQWCDIFRKYFTHLEKRLGYWRNPLACWEYRAGIRSTFTSDTQMKLLLMQFEDIINVTSLTCVWPEQWKPSMSFECVLTFDFELTRSPWLQFGFTEISVTSLTTCHSVGEREAQRLWSQSPQPVHTQSGVNL